MTRPRVTLKLATSLDGRIATASGESRWITGKQAREQGHRLRAEHDAVLVGAETALADDPELTVRLDRYDGRQPLRVVLDSRQRLPLDSKLIRTARAAPVWLLTCTPPKAELVEAGVRVVQVETAEARPDPVDVLERLGEGGVASVLIEGGGQVAASFLRAGLVDRIEWFRAPVLLGAEGRPGVGPLLLEALASAPKYRRVSVEPVGDDLWERYEKA